jgi:Ni,Fe-hydrogenase I cytochrome b subunit
MDAASTVHTYSPLPSKEVWRPSLFHRAHQSIVKSPVVAVVVLIAVMLLSFMAGGALMYVYSSHYHSDFEQTHLVDIVNASCSGECEETKQSSTQCLNAIKAINYTVTHVGNSRAHLLQMKSDVKHEIATLQFKNASLVPHTRRRPPVETWNT